MRKINESKLIKDYLEFSFDIKIMAHKYANKNHITLNEALDKVETKINKYAI